MLCKIITSAKMSLSIGLLTRTFLFLNLCSLTKLEARKPDQRPIPNTYYYLDYKIFVDVVKYKIHRMGKELDSVMSKV